MKSRFRSSILCATLIASGFVTLAQGEMVGITPILDNTIYSESSNSNALGNLFSGRNNQAAPGIRRAILQFDIAGNVPAGATINSVSLGLYLLKASANSTIESFELYPLLSAWGEGTSSSTAGSGAPATQGDATWTHRFFSNDLWISPGGDFGPISGTGTIGTTLNTPYTFASQSGMVAEVQNWLDSPTSNFGWILRAANESVLSNTREFASREVATISQRPTLFIDYTPVPEPNSLLLVGLAVFFTSANRHRRRT